MFKKFGKLLVLPFILTSLNSFLINSPADASTAWTDWSKCKYNLRDYTWWRARVEVRSTDKAVRVVQVEFSGDNDAQVWYLEAWDSWETGGQRRHSDAHPEKYNPAVSINRSVPFTTTWMSTRVTRYANIKLWTTGKGMCSDEFRI
jgi:hypothetical protein